MKRIAIDMDEVLAQHTAKVLRVLAAENQHEVSLEQIQGTFLSKVLPEDLLAEVSKYPDRPGFFRDLEIIPDSQEVVEALTKRYEVFIASSAMMHPNCLQDKWDWIEEHFPFIPDTHRIFCGNKSVLRMDYLIDDHPKNLLPFGGKPLLFHAYHNVNDTRFERLSNWQSARELLLS